jgi:hypothetical protein
MRLFEVADRFVDDLETILRNLVGRGDSKHAPQSLTWPALGNMLKNMGYGGLTYDQFAKVYDENPQIQPLIRDYNDQGLVLGTKEEPEGGEEQSTEVPDGPSVDQMASSGAKQHLDDLS